MAYEDYELLDKPERELPGIHACTDCQDRRRQIEIKDAQIEALHSEMEKKAPTVWHEMMQHDADVRERSLQNENTRLRGALESALGCLNEIVMTGDVPLTVGVVVQRGIDGITKELEATK